MRRAGRLAGGTALCTLAGFLAATASASAATTVDYFPSSSGSQININGEADADNVAVFQDGNTVTLADPGPGGITTADADCSNVAGVVACPFDPADPAPPAEPNAPLEAILMGLQAGNDSFSTAGPFRLLVDAGDGEDTINGGPRDDLIAGGQGNDTIFAGDGDDFITGSPLFSQGAAGSDHLDGQGGVDSIDFSRLEAVNVSLDDQGNDGIPGEEDNAIGEQIDTGLGDDVVTGNAQANRIRTGTGNDTLIGLEGSDVLSAGSGDDALDGGPQRDRFVCADDFDTAIVDPRDVAFNDCERTGAVPLAGTSIVNKKSKAKVGVECPAPEANACDGALVLVAGSKEIGSAAFSVAAGQSGKATVKLNADGRKLLGRNGGTMLVSAEARTTEPIGTSVSEADVLLQRKSG